MSFTVRVPSRVIRYLDRLPSRIRNQVLDRFERLAAEPFDPVVSEPLSGRWAGHRKSRVGDYRIIYVVREEQLEIRVVRVGPRGDVYKE